MSTAPREVPKQITAMGTRTAVGSELERAQYGGDGHPREPEPVDLVTVLGYIQDHGRTALPGLDRWFDKVPASPAPHAGREPVSTVPVGSGVATKTESGSTAAFTASRRSVFGP
ncbi:hypothetical protein GCM10018773_30380 [Streptomyces candidus]|nr:hypothetical protein GCM10018773_30380 [Streptomyces candidus]